MGGSRTDARLIATLLLVSLASVGSTASAKDVDNLTGLPVYPNLSDAQMDGVAKTDALGHWCIRFAAETFDRLDVVEAWYRKALGHATETDLNHDERYKTYNQLSGIKFALGVDSVTVFRTADKSTTTIELFRCSAQGNGG
jgi:hypothetical protein